MRPIAAIFALLATCLPACDRADSATPDTSGETSAADADDVYCVVSLVDPTDPYFRAVRQLVLLHDASVLSADPTKIEEILPRLREERPDYVAIVVKPETLDVNLVRRFMRVATEVDEDPFLDFAYGFITGDSAETALALVEAGQKTNKQRKPAISMIGVMEGGFLKESKSTQQQWPLRRGSLTQTAHTIVSSGKDSDRDTAFIQSAMLEAERSPLLLLAGHGYPDEVVGGPTYEHLSGRNFDGTVAFNIACYTGVTGTWYENDWRTMKVKEREVPPSESFCLNMLKTGVAGYVAYACPRPSGPTMLADAMTAAIAGESLGELRRVDGNSVILAHLQQGFDSLQIHEETDGKPIDPKRKTQDLLIEMSTGGLLFGDPACKPFAATDGADLRSVTVSRAGDKLEGRVEITGPLWHFYCSDQIVMWDDKTPSRRIEAKIPLDGRYAANVRLKESSFGDSPHQLTAATEQHDGKRYLHVKATFKQPTMMQLMKIGKTIHGVFEVTTSESPAERRIIRSGAIGDGATR